MRLRLHQVLPFATTLTALSFATYGCKTANKTASKSDFLGAKSSEKNPTEDGRKFPQNGKLALTFSPGSGGNAGGNQVLASTPESTTTMIDLLGEEIMQVYPNPIAVTNGWTSLTIDASGKRKLVYYVDSELGYVDPITREVLYCDYHHPVGHALEVSILDCYPLANFSEMSISTRYSNGASVFSGSNILNGSGTTIYNNSSGNWLYPNGQTLYNSSLNRYYWPTGETMMTGADGDLLYTNGRTAFSSSSQTLYFDDGYTWSSSGVSRFVNGSIAKNGSRIEYYNSGLFVNTSGSTIDLRYSSGFTAKSGSRDQGTIYNTSSGEALARIIETYRNSGYQYTLGATRHADFAGLDFDFGSSTFFLRSQFKGSNASQSSPLGLRLTAGGTNFLEVRWDSPSSSVTGYKALITTANPPATCSGGITLGNVRTYRFTNLQIGTRYNILVCSTSPGGLVSPPAVLAANTTDAPPPAPAGLSASSNLPGRVKLQWTLGGTTTASYSYSFIAGTSSPNDCSQNPISKVSTVTITVTPNTTYTLRLCALSALGTMSQGTDVTFTTPPTATNGFYFGGVLGIVNGTGVPNPATGTTSCPSGYSSHQFAGTGGVDYNLIQCYQYPSSSTPIVDFGGAFGYVNDVQTVNPVTGRSSCPPGFTGTLVYGTPGTDWPLTICTRPSTPGVVEPAKFGGFFGLVENQDSYNPASGTADCVSGFSKFKVLGSNADRSAFLCYKIDTNAPAFDPTNIRLVSTVPTRMIARWESGGGSTTGFRIAWAQGTTPPTNCNGSNSFEVSTTSAIIQGLTGNTTYSVRVCAKNGLGDLSAGTTLTGSTFGPTTVLPGVDYGGMFGTAQTQPNTNPATGAASCPSGYTATAIYGTPGVDFSITMCHRPRVAGQTPALLFGGFFGAVEGAAVVNPFTGNLNCPSGYTAQLVNGTNGFDHALYSCYAPYNVNTPEYGFFGGMIGTVNATQINNPVTSAKSCPADFTEYRLLGTNNLDWGMTGCYQQNILQPPPSVAGLALRSETPSTLTASWQHSLGFLSSYVVKIVAGNTPPADCSGGTATVNNTFTFSGLSQNTAYSVRICAQNSLFLTGAGTTGTGTTAPVNVALPGLEFGGYVGFVDNKVVPNPLTNAVSCPPGFDAASLILGTPRIDGNVAYCFRPRNSSVAPAIDYGGVIGVVNGAPVPNPVTGAVSCPAGFTFLLFKNTPGFDYPAGVCLRLATPGIPSPAIFGGGFGYVNGAPAVNPATGGMNCLPDFVATQFSGHPTLDYPAWFCTKNQ